MKKTFKLTSLIIALILMFSLIGCTEPHEHKFVNGACECGEVHDCVYTNGACTCGKVHDCVYVNGACSCGKVHDCEYVNGACSCGKEHDCVYENGKCDCGKEKELTTVSDFDEFLVNTGYTESVYSKVIEYNGVLLYQEDIHSTYKDNGYVNAGGTKELGEDGVYLVDSFISEENQATEITLKLLEEYFEKFTINEKTLEGKIKDSSSEALLFVQAKVIAIKVVIGENYKVSSIELSYVDYVSNFNVSYNINYKY